MHSTQTSHRDYHLLHQLDVLGLKNCPGGDQEVVYEKFKEQLQRDSAKLGGIKLPYPGEMEIYPYKTTGK